MTNYDALIGYTGFVGSNLLLQKEFGYCYNTDNIDDIEGMWFDMAVCAAPSGTRWLANTFPEADLQQVKRLASMAEHVNTDKFVLISTIDVYGDSAYGRHRRELENVISDNHNSLIIRLPSVYGENMEGGLVWDIINKQHEFYPAAGRAQFYNLANLWGDITIALDNDLDILNIATEPIGVRELWDYGQSGNMPDYDMESDYAHLWGKEGDYLYSKDEIMADVKKFIDENTAC